MRALVILAALMSAAGAPPPGQPAQSAPGFRIVVIAGEDAVNVIQQKSAVAPIVEVRDRNDQPVAGVVVRFAVQGGRATFGGAQTLTVTTNAAGRAVATGLAPTGSGALQISATATIQGQTAAVTIAQSNVMTAAEAVAASSSSASGGAGANAGAGAAGGSGGISGTTLGIVGAAVGGGAIAATTALKEGDAGITYSGSFSGQTTDVLTPNGACAITVRHAGTVSVKIQLTDSGSVNGTGDVGGTMTVVSGSAGCPTGTALAPIGNSQNHGCCNPPPAVGGTRASLSFSGNHPGGAGTNWFYEFTGVLNEPNIDGTFTLTTTYQNNIPGPSVRVFPLRLSRAAR